MIDFELSEGVQNTQRMVHAVAEQMMRPIAREYDEREHEKPWDFLRTMWQVSHANPIGGSGYSTTTSAASSGVRRFNRAPISSPPTANTVSTP